jgi:hypothetical protein
MSKYLLDSNALRIAFFIGVAWISGRNNLAARGT